MDKLNQKNILEILSKAKSSSFGFSRISSDEKSKVLKNMAKALIDNKDYILKENQKDIKNAVIKKLSSSFLDRLKLDDKRLTAMSSSIKQISLQKDPIGEIISGSIQPNGLRIRKERVPLGVVFIVYESRPNVTSDCIALCLRSSNVCILRGGSDAIYSNKAIFNALKSAAKDLGLDKFMFYIENPQHQVIDFILKNAKDYIDLVIPRGGEALVEKVTKLSTAPVIKHYKGICHIYVDKSADLKMAKDIIINAKVQRPSVCNAVETILIHKQIADKFLPDLKEDLDKYKVEIRGCDRTLTIIPTVAKAKPSDWGYEYLDLILSCKVVDDLTSAVNHINKYGSAHTDSIIAEDVFAAEEFTNLVSSACVFVNTSTRFSDGGEFGLGAEIGISTDKIHARGPMGAEELTTYKYIVYSNGCIRK